MPARSIWSILSVLLLIGCSAASDTPTGPSTPTTAQFRYTCSATNARPLLTYGRLIAWVRIEGDSNWTRKIPFGYFNSQSDTIYFTGNLALPPDSTTLGEVVLSLEQDSSAGIPTTPLATMTTFAADSSSFDIASSLGNLASAAATVTFATASADTARSHQEWYLMTNQNGVAQSSVTGLPIAPQGWRYALWVVDSAFVPFHQFYYGSFTNPNGPDDDTTVGDLPFPGGYNPASINDAGAEILLTLEPSWRFAASAHPTSPSPLTILAVPLRRFLHNGLALQMTNVTATSFPTGTFSIQQN